MAPIADILSYRPGALDIEPCELQTVLLNVWTASCKMQFELENLEAMAGSMAAENLR